MEAALDHESIYQDPHFWAALSFVIFVLIALRPAARYLARTLDGRSTAIATELAEARRLRKEAEETLSIYQQKQSESLKEAEHILAETRAGAKVLAERAEQDLKAAMEKRMKLATDRIAQAEAKAIEEVQAHVVNIALQAAKTLISKQVSKGAANDELVKQAAEELGRKLH